VKLITRSVRSGFACGEARGQRRAARESRSGAGSLSDAQLDARTACSKSAVRRILEHMIGGATMFAGAFRGTAPVAGYSSDRKTLSRPGGTNTSPRSLRA
jgi:hypothetical protein